MRSILAVKLAGLLDGDPVIKMPDMDIPVQGAATNLPARVRQSLAENNKTTNFLVGGATDRTLQEWNRTYLKMPAPARQKWDQEAYNIHSSLRGGEYNASSLGDSIYDRLSSQGMVTPNAWNSLTGAGQPQNTPAAMAEILGAATARHAPAPAARKPGQSISTKVTPTSTKPAVPAKPAFVPRTKLPPNYKGPKPPGVK